MILHTHVDEEAHVLHTTLTRCFIQFLCVISFKMELHKDWIFWATGSSVVKIHDIDVCTKLDLWCVPK